MFMANLWLLLSANSVPQLRGVSREAMDWSFCSFSSFLMPHKMTYPVNVLCLVGVEIVISTEEKQQLTN